MMRIYKNYPLLDHNTFRLPIQTQWFIEYESEKDLQKLLKHEYFFSQPIYHIGQGSNLLFLDDFEGVIIHSGIRGIEVIEENTEFIRVKVSAAEDWDSFVLYCIHQGWGGIENLSLIPGEVGASAFQNIGAYGVDVSDVIEEVHFYSTQTREKQIFSCQECNYSYRDSFFKRSKELFFITHVVYRLFKKPSFQLHHSDIQALLKGVEINLQSVRKAIIAIRQSRLPDPQKIGNAGSFFINPYISRSHYKRLKKQYSNMPCYLVDEETVKIPAAWLIEQCGGKRKSVGDATIYEKQSLVIINKGHATGKEIAQLALEIVQQVKDTFKIELKSEVVYL